MHNTEQLGKRIVEVNCVRKLVRLAKEMAGGLSAFMWAGDLNFRSIEVEASEFSKAVQKQESAEMMELVEKHDQLASLKDLDGIFNFVDEAPITFMYRNSTMKIHPLVFSE